MEYIFEKYRVNGKDYLIFDIARHEYELTSEKIRRICHHHFGVGVSGVIMGACNGDTSVVNSYDADGNLEEQNYTAICAFVQFIKDQHFSQAETLLIQTNSEDITVNQKKMIHENGQEITRITMSIQSDDLMIAAGAEDITFSPSTISFFSSQVRETGKIITSEQFIQSL